MLAQRRGRQANLKPALGQRLVFVKKKIKKRWKQNFGLIFFRIQWIFNMYATTQSILHTHASKVMSNVRRVFCET